MGLEAIILSEEGLYFTVTDVSFHFQNAEERNYNTTTASLKSGGVLW